MRSHPVRSIGGLALSCALACTHDDDTTATGADDGAATGASAGTDASGGTSATSHGSEGHDDAATTAVDTTAGEDSGGPHVTPGGPVLFFSDLASAPRTGNTDDSFVAGHGAYVTVWGKHLGGADVSVAVGGVPATVIATGPADHPADLYTRMGVEMIVLQVPADAPLGDAPITVEVAGVASNALAFVTRDSGRILFVQPDGSDGGDGSWTSPWQSFDRVSEAIENGDVVYFGDGFVDTSGQSDTGFFGLNSDGTPELPKALVAYPGATVDVGRDDCEPTGHALVANYSGALDRGTTHWVIAKLRITSPESCAQDTAVEVAEGFRLIGNYLSTPRTSDGCQSGAVQCGGLDTCGDDIYMLGNELAYAQTTNAATGSKQCHGFYISGNRQDDGVERNREIAWNYIHDCDNNRGINIYNESYNGEGQPRAQIEAHRIHDNWMENQRGIGILIGADVTGDNWLYNNVLVNTGLGPEFPDGGGFFPLQLQPGSAYAPTSTDLYVSNNLVWGASYPGGPDYAVGLVWFASDPTSPTTLHLQDNIFASTEDGVEYVDPEASSIAGSSHNLWFGAGDPPPDDGAPVTGDPALADPAAFDFHPTAGSPARGTGVPVEVGALDFDGLPRDPAAWSIGPYQ